MDSGPYVVFEISFSVPNLFLGFYGLMLLVTLSLASSSARLALAEASGGLFYSIFYGELMSLALKLIEGIFVPNPFEAFVVYGIFLVTALLIPIFLPFM